MSDTRLRARAFLADNLATVAVALVVLAAAGGWLAYDAVATPPTETETRVVSSWSTTGSFDHGARVVSENPLYPVGTTLSDRPVYFRDVSPTVGVTFRYGLDGTTRGTLSATVRARLVVSEVRAGADPGDGSTVLWRTSRELGRWRETDLEPGDSATFPVVVNASRVARRTAAIQADLGAGVGATRTRVVYDVAIEGRVGGRRVANETQYVLPLSIDRSTVAVDEPGPATARRERTRQVTVARRPGVARVGATALLAAGAGLALVGLVLARRDGRLAPSPAERAAVEHERARREYDEWITEGRLPPEVRSWPRVEVESLSGLVDAAIDTDGRVVEDDGEYVVPGRGLVYAYVPSGIGNDGRSARTAGGTDEVQRDEAPSGRGDGATDRTAADLLRRVLDQLDESGRRGDVGVGHERYGPSEPDRASGEDRTSARGDDSTAESAAGATAGSADDDGPTESAVDDSTPDSATGPTGPGEADDPDRAV